MKRSFSKRIISLFLSIVMLVCTTCCIDYIAKAEDTDFIHYKFSYLSDVEAKAYLGFLLGENDVDEDLWNTDVYYYLTGRLFENRDRENKARMAFVYIANRLLNERIDEQTSNANVASADLITFLENKYGTNMDAELVQPLINAELRSIKDVILEFVAIATETDSVEIEAVDTLFSTLEVIVNYKEKVDEYYQCIKAIFDTAKFTSSVQHADMYNQFALYIYSVRTHLDFSGENQRIAQMIVELTQDAYDLHNERVLWVNAIEAIVKLADRFGKLNDYWLDWNTDSRIALMKKWAHFYEYSRRACEEDVDPIMTDSSISNVTITSSSGKTITYKQKSYKIKITLSHVIEDTDLEYTKTSNGVKITRFNAYEGKYHYVTIPGKIAGLDVTEIGPGVFEDASFESVIIPESVEVIGNKAFYNNPSLDIIAILNDNVKIGDKAFDWNLGAANQTIGNTYVYCNMPSSAVQFCNQNEGFVARNVAWNGNTKWGIAALNKEYHINTAAELNYISDLVKNGADLNGFKIVVDSNINLNNKAINPIGQSQEMPYKGSFNGNNHRIYNYRASSINNYSGIFGYVSAENSSFSNITISGIKPEIKEYVGGLIGYANIKYSGKLTIKNIHTNVSDLDEMNQRGGIIGKIESNGQGTINISESSNENILSTYNAFGGNSTGGIVGSIQASNTDNFSFFRCYNSGSLYASLKGGYSTSYCGGIIGTANKGNYLISECAVGGLVSGTSYYTNTGGIVSVFSPTSFKIENCGVFARIESECVNGESFCAGMIGRLYLDNILDQSKCYIKNSYCSNICNADYIAAFAIINTDATRINIKVINSYFDIGKTTLKTRTSSSLNTNTNDFLYLCMTYAMFSGSSKPTNTDFIVDSGVKYSNALKNDESLYSNWDFDNIWEHVESGYPILKHVKLIQPCHNHSYIVRVIKPTCTEGGYTYNRCSNCGYTCTTDYTSATGHNYKYIKAVVATCNSKGYDVYICSVCSETKTENETEMLDGTALKSSINTAKNKLEKDYYTPLSKSQLSTVYENHKNDPDILTNQVDVDNATNEILEAIAALELVDSYEKRLNENISWRWEKESKNLTFSGTGTLPSSSDWNDFIFQTENIIIEEGITNIGTRVFYSNAYVKNISMPESLTGIGERAFEFCTSVEELTIPDNVVSIGYGAFANMTALKKVTVPASTSYCSYCFDKDVNVEKVVITKGTNGIIPDSQYTSEQSYFYSTRKGNFGPWKYANDCSVIISEGVSVIGKNTFWESRGIREIHIPSTMAEMNLNNGTFYRNYNLCIIEVAESNCVYCSVNNCIYSKDMSQFLLYPQGSKASSFTMPSTVQEVRSYAFNDCYEFEDLYYFGTQEEWNNIVIGVDNTPLLNANIHFLDQPSDSSALVASIQEAHSYTKAEYTSESVEYLYSVANSYVQLANRVAPQSEYDSAVEEILSAIRQLDPLSRYTVSSFDGKVVNMTDDFGKETKIVFIEHINEYCASLDVVEDGIVNAKDFAYLLRNY
ncbi:MAG: leucine-rich repeat protein [Eubacterium sp.]|nr:leucine-rich repeat protein [Eubacterium sp.]